MTPEIPDTDWTPTQTDIAWQQNMIRVLRENGVWGVPMNQSTFVISHKNKTFKLVAGNYADETNKRIAKIFRLLGYAQIFDTIVIDAENNNNSGGFLT